MYPKLRIDALTDGIFAVAMTLLVLDVRVPDDVHPKNSAELIAALGALMPRVVPYVVSFLVLGIRWLANLRADSARDTVGEAWARWWLVYMLLITCVPFSTLVVGRFGHFPPAVWIYAANTLLVALVGTRMRAEHAERRHGRAALERRLGPWLLIVASGLAVALSFLVGAQALWIYALTALSPVLARRLGGDPEKAAA